MLLLDNKSRMRRESHVRICEKSRVKFLRLTRPHYPSNGRLSRIESFYFQSYFNRAKGCASSQFFRTEFPRIKNEFLSVGLEEYSRDNDLDELLYTIQCIAVAKGDTLELVESTVVDKSALAKLLLVNPNPSWDEVVQALGYTSLETASGLIPSF